MQRNWFFCYYLFYKLFSTAPKKTRGSFAKTKIGAVLGVLSPLILKFAPSNNLCIETLLLTRKKK